MFYIGITITVLLVLHDLTIFGYIFVNLGVVQLDVNALFAVSYLAQLLSLKYDCILKSIDFHF